MGTSGHQPRPSLPHSACSVDGRLDGEDCWRVGTVLWLGDERGRPKAERGDTRPSAVTVTIAARQPDRRRQRRTRGRRGRGHEHKGYDGFTLALVIDANHGV